MLSPLGEKLAKVGQTLWRGFAFLFKISIVVTLVAYFVIFLAMMVALVFARRSDDRDEGGGFDLGWPLFWMWGWEPTSQGPYGRRRHAPRKGKPLYKKVFEFVFGPPRPREDPFARREGDPGPHSPEPRSHRGGGFGHPDGVGLSPR